MRTSSLLHCRALVRFERYCFVCLSGSNGGGEELKEGEWGRESKHFALDEVVCEVEAQ